MAGGTGTQVQPQVTLQGTGQNTGIRSLQTVDTLRNNATTAPEMIASSLKFSGLGAAREMDYQPLNVQAAQVGSQGYNAAQARAQQAAAQQAAAQQAIAQGYSAQQAVAERAGSQGYGAERIAGVGPITAQQVQAGQLAGTSLDPYFNPYESQVVQQSLSDLERQRQIQQNMGGAQAQAAGAFGGSRQGIAEAETNRAFAEQAARTASGLRQAGFTQAQAAAQQDIAARMQASLANQGANLQAATTTGQFGMQQQLANQAAMNQAAQFGAQAANVASLQNAQIGTQANLANQAAQNQALQFGAQAQNVAGLQNAQLGTQAALQNAQLGTQASLQNAQLGTQANLSNAAALNAAGQFGAQAGNQAALANQQAMMAAQQANQQAGLQGSAQRLGAASQLGQAANLGFGMVNTINQQVAQQGLQEQMAQQALIDAARNQYAGYTGAPQQALQTSLGAFGGSQTGVQTQTQSRQPGLFDYLTLGATAMGGGR